MRKSAGILLAILGSAIVFTSCRKNDYTCTCNYQDSKTGQPATQKLYIHDTKKKANDRCGEYGNYFQSLGAFHISCSIND